jgi:hypothetical protein
MLQPQDDGGLACGSGCGTWITSSVITKLLGTTDLTKRGTPAPFFKVTPLPATPCFVCATQLEPVYRAAGDDYVTLGECAEHGVWCEQRGRADFELAFRKEIANHSVEGPQRINAKHEEKQLVEALAQNPKAMARRIMQLESLVDELASRLEALERTRL